MAEMVGLIAVSGGLAVRLAIREFTIVKEIADLVLSSIALIVFSPVLLVCAILIKFSDGGPVFFTQKRVGKNGKIFTMYKLRSMRVNAEAESGEVWASEQDPRILPVCRWMRLSHVDELPQLINIIIGDMSLIGPRPEREEILNRLEKKYPNVRRRLEMRPGITGLAQIRAGYDTTDEHFCHKLDADLEYIENHDLMMDIRILLATFPKFYDSKAK